MSILSGTKDQRRYPLSPPPHNETKVSQDTLCQLPQTPQSPLRPVSASADKSSPIEAIRPAIGTSLSTSVVDTSEDSAPSRPGETIQTLSDQPGDISMDIEDTSNKRKRGIEDEGDQDHQKRFHVEDRRLGIEDLHLDVGKKYLLCRTRKIPIPPTSFLLGSLHFRQKFYQVFTLYLLYYLVNMDFDE